MVIPVVPNPVQLATNEIRNLMVVITSRSLSEAIMALQRSLTAPKVSVHNGRAVTTSVDVADYFGKLHKNAIQKIESIDCSEKFNRLNFQPVDYIDAKGEKHPMFKMTKDGFVFLVMGFTGKKAAAFKEAYIAEFNRMEERLHGAVAVSGVTSEILLTLQDNKVISSRPIVNDEYVASLDTLFEIARRADYLVIHKDDLIKKTR
ncbi:Rha family transcriptional regulator [Sodalis glossinidius]|uniref:Rha family transcriptional regulator n=1 Tax=Sodalis glossinidius TaxID=63612 RepID=UPI000321E11C|nr:Rha family transcriptional regulator [Sodalis glossinidius]